MATMLRILGRRVAELARQNPGNVIDGIRAVGRYLSGRPAPPRPPVRGNPRQVHPLAGRELIVANRSTIRRWMWWLGAIGGGLLGGGFVFWFFRRDGGEVAEIADGVAHNNAGGGGGNNADGGGDGGIDPAFLIFQMMNAVAWNGGDNRNGDAGAAEATAPGDEAGVSNSAGDAATGDSNNARA